MTFCQFWLLRSWLAALRVQLGDCVLEPGADLLEAEIGCRRPCPDEISTCRQRAQAADSFLQPPAEPVAHDRVPHAPPDGVRQRRRMWVGGWEP